MPLRFAQQAYSYRTIYRRVGLRNRLERSGGSAAILPLCTSVRVAQAQHPLLRDHGDPNCQQLGGWSMHANSVYETLCAQRMLHGYCCET